MPNPAHYTAFLPGIRQTILFIATLLVAQVIAN